MIKVNYTKENDYYKKIEVLGHALYDDLGKDIVCSAVSSITTTSVKKAEKAVIQFTKNYKEALVKQKLNKIKEDFE